MSAKRRRKIRGTAGLVETVEVACAFCAGKGTDPFGVMYEGATCQVCGGAGVRKLAPPVARCPFCGGRGVYHGTRLTCTSCRGIGQVSIPKDAVTCPACDGGGWARDEGWTSSPMPCSFCRGKGVVAAPRISTPAAGKKADEKADKTGVDAV